MVDFRIFPFSYCLLPLIQNLGSKVTFHYEIYSNLDLGDCEFLQNKNRQFNNKVLKREKAHDFFSNTLILDTCVLQVDKFHNG